MFNGGCEYSSGFFDGTLVGHQFFVQISNWGLLQSTSMVGCGSLSAFSYSYFVKNGFCSQFHNYVINTLVYLD